MDADGSDCRQLMRSGDGLDYNPTWSPDGRQIGFRTTRGESPPGVDPSDIFVVNADGSGERELTTPENSQSGLFPAWSPDGELIAFGGSGGINLIRPDGTLRRHIGLEGDECSVWSPDSVKILVCSNALNRGEGADNWDIFVMDADGSNRRRLTWHPQNDYPGAWSPDGRRIVFGRGCGGGGDCDLYVMNADGSGVRQLTDDPGAETANAWLPDGRLLVGIWAPGQEGPPAWVLMDGDGGDRRELPQLAQAMDPVDYLPSP
jgi:TolB protein